MSNWTKFRWTKQRVVTWSNWIDMLEDKRIQYARYTGNGGTYEHFAFCPDHITPEEVSELVENTRPTFCPEAKYTGCIDVFPHEVNVFVGDAYVGNPPNKQILYY